jgi:hypothetical protein
MIPKGKRSTNKNIPDPDLIPKRNIKNIINNIKTITKIIKMINPGVKSLPVKIVKTENEGIEVEVSIAKKNIDIEAIQKKTGDINKILVDNKKDKNTTLMLKSENQEILTARILTSKKEEKSNVYVKLTRKKQKKCNKILKSKSSLMPRKDNMK